MAPKRSERSGNMSIRHVIILAQNKRKQTKQKNPAALPRTGDSHPETSTGMLGKVVLLSSLET